MFVCPEFDLALAVGHVPWVLTQLDREGVPLVYESLAEGTWDAAVATGHGLVPLVTVAAAAWIVQRPGCAGLVTRVVLCDAHGTPFGAIAAARDPGAREPMAWRVYLLLALLADPFEPAALQAAK